jgi:hypothetical protein
VVLAIFAITQEHNELRFLPLQKRDEAIPIRTLQVFLTQFLKFSTKLFSKPLYPMS